MKLLIASDIHGSASYCQKLLSAFVREEADEMLLLGDLLYHGPRNDLPQDYAPKEVISLLSAYAESIMAVRGNCDTEVDQMVLPFPLLADYSWIYADGIRIFATHGHRYTWDALPPLRQGDLFLYGHTHVPFFGEQNGVFGINPGSVSIPKEGSHHGYVILEDGKAFFRDLEGRLVAEHVLR